MKFSNQTFVIAILLFLIMGIGCSKKSTNSSDPIPAELIGIWWFESGSINDDPISSFSEVAHNPSALAGSTTYNADGTWSSGEYEYIYASTPIFTQSGTFSIHGNTLAVRRTMYDGEPVSPAEEFSFEFVVSGDVLTLSETQTVMSEIWTIVTVYSRD